MPFHIKIENVVASANLMAPIKLEKVVANLQGIEYEPEQFPGVVYRMQNPKAAALIFSSGKLVCTGTKSPGDAKMIVGRIVTQLRKLGIKIPSTYTVRVENMVASASLDRELNLDSIAFELENTEYEPEQFPGVVYRMQNPKAAALIFSSGKLVCTGTKSPGDAKMIVGRIVTQLRKLGIKIPSTYTVRVENMVASASLDKELNLDSIAFDLENTEYEPEQFPGLVYRMDDPKVTFLLFGSGKIICTGGRSIKDVERAIAKLDKRVKQLK